MSYETPVTAPPIGVSRSADWHVNPDGTGLDQTIVRGRLLGTVTSMRTSSNADSGGAGMVLTGAYQLLPVQIAGKWLRMCKLQGSAHLGPIIPLQTFRPTLKEVVWPIGRYVLEAITYWSAAPGAAVDSGICLAPADAARVNGLNHHGIMLGNVAGVLRFYTRGPGGFESVDVSALAGPLNSLNKLTLVIRQPGFNRPASVTALVNDRIAAAREWVGAHKLPLTDNLLAALSPQLVHANNVVDCWMTDIRMSCGPDVPDL
jgi:hypothetical protein